MCWDTAQSLDIFFDLKGEFEYCSHHFGYAGSSSATNTLDDLHDSIGYWIHLGDSNEPTRKLANLEDI